MSTKHPFDEVSDEIIQWLDKESDWYAEALKGEYRSPFSAGTTESQKLDFYRRKMYQQNPDGTPNYEQPNVQGRNELIQRVGVKQYAQIANAVGPGKTEKHLQTLDSDTGQTPSEEY